jgi:hypothetical protein
MVTGNEILSNIKNMKSGGRATSDFSYSDDNIMHWVSAYGNMLRKKDIETTGEIDDSNVQDLGVQTLVTVDAADSAVIKFGYDIKKLVIPATLQLDKMDSITYLGTIDKGVQSIPTIIPLVKGDAIALRNYTKFPNKIKVKSYLIGNTLYFVGANAINLCYVNVRGIFEDPLEIKYCGVPDGIPVCTDLSCPYPIPEYLLPQLYAIIEELLNEGQKNIQIIRHEKGGFQQQAI